MNSLKKSILKSNLCKHRCSFVNCISKSKFNRISQPGLLNNNIGGQDAGYYHYYSSLTYGSNAENLISRVPTIEVDDNIALCYGVQDYGWGHPVEYIQLNNKDLSIPSVCKYCGLKYLMKNHENNKK